MSLILGIHDGTHNAGACLLLDGKVIAACDEERFTRVKNSGGFPDQSIKACLDIAGLSIADIDHCAFAGLVNPNPLLRLFRGQQKNWKLDQGKFYQPERTLASRFSDWVQFRSPFPYLQSSKAIYAPILRRILQRQLQKSLHTKAKVQLFDHHHCHASSAYFGSGFSDSLVLVADGLGDGLCLSVWQGQGLQLNKIGSMPFPNSYGLLYSSLTGFLGFRPFRHEGKLTGLSALGDASNIPLAFPFTGDFPNRRTTLSYPLHGWLKNLEGYSKEDISAWVQVGIEHEILGIIGHYVEKMGTRNLALAGGIFANVRLNQKIAEDSRLDNIFVFPNMGDAGLSVGAGYLMAIEQSESPEPFDTAFLGIDIRVSDVLEAISGSGFKHSQPDLIEKTAQVLSEGGIIARCQGRMEYGPRSLGNRSILAPASNPEITNRLNELLDRSDFMPFAPIIRAENIARCLEPQPNSLHTAQWMTINFQATKTMKALCPAIVHVDGSLRPQIVHQSRQPELWAILERYEQLTGLPALINTSFNIHEEPIVASAQDAVRTFGTADFDGMILGEYWMEKNRDKS